MGSTISYNMFNDAFPGASISGDAECEIDRLYFFASEAALTDGSSHMSYLEKANFD